MLVADGGPAGVERDPPVEPDHVAARAGELLQQWGRQSGPEVDRRHVDGLEDPRRVRRHELRIVLRRERAGPGVEELDHVRAGVGLRGHVAGEVLVGPEVADVGATGNHPLLTLCEVLGADGPGIVARCSGRTRPRLAARSGGRDLIGSRHVPTLLVRYPVAHHGQRQELGDSRDLDLDRLPTETRPRRQEWEDHVLGELASEVGVYRPSSMWAIGVAPGNDSVMPELM